MYDPLKHFIAEGLVVLHSYPHPETFGRMRGRFLKTGGVEMEVAQPMGPLGGHELRVKHKNVWFVYPIDESFWDDYTTKVANKEESKTIEQEWKATLEQTRQMANLSQLV